MVRELGRNPRAHRQKSSNKQNVIAMRSSAQCSGRELRKRGQRTASESGLKVLLQLAYKINNFFAAAVGKKTGQGHSFNMNLHVRLTMAAQDSQGRIPASVLLLGSSAPPA